jgi:Flp pilus assembly pilin Flp
MPKFLADRRATSSLEYAVLAAVLGIMLIQVLQVPAQSIATVLSGLFGGDGGGASH